MIFCILYQNTEKSAYFCCIFAARGNRVPRSECLIRKFIVMYELKYYLDTNAVRSFSPQLKRCGEMGAFTSIWTICEMLGRVLKNPKDFDKIQKNLKEVKDSGICVATKLPMELHYDAFSIIPSVEPFSYEILKLVIILINAKSLEEFLIRVSLHSLDGIVKFIKGIDNATDRFNKSLQTHFDASKSSRESIEEYKEFVANEDKQLTHKRLVEYFVDGFIENSSDVRKMGVYLGFTYEKFKEFLCNAYNGSIDVAIRVIACFVNKKVSYRDRCAKNDDIDMMHLYYLQDDIVLVSNDKMLLDNVNAEFPGRAISNDDFKKIINLV